MTVPLAAFPSPILTTGDRMKQCFRAFGVSFLTGCAALLEHYFQIYLSAGGDPHGRLIRLVATQQEGRGNQEGTERLHTAIDGLVLPRFVRVERRQRGWSVPEPPKKRTVEPGDYVDWEMFCKPRNNQPGKNQEAARNSESVTESASTFTAAKLRTPLFAP